MSAPFGDLLRLPWVVWRHGGERSAGKRSKIPYNPRTGQCASVNAPSTWGTYAEAVIAADQYDGIGVVLTPDDPLVGLDLDRCRDPETGVIASWAQDIVAELNTYTEATPSGTGLRLLCWGALPSRGRKRGQVEMYESARFLTITGQHVPETPVRIENRANAVWSLYARVFGDATNGQRTRVHSDALTSDDRVLERACSASNGARFRALWDGDCRDYTSQSEADLALCSMLSYWTVQDAERVDRLFRCSGLMREKWDQLHGDATYGQHTIEKAMTMKAQGVPDAPGPKPRHAKLVRLADVEPQSVEWLWEGRIPRGKVTLLIGDPGQGKSSVAIDFVARVSTGGGWPDGCPAPLGNAIILSAEDGPADTIRPRLDRFGGDPARVFLLQAVMTGPREQFFNLQSDLEVLDRAIIEQHATVVVFDPLSAYLGKVDSWKDSEVRGLLGPVAALAERTGVTVLGIVHLTKDSDKQAIHRALGSIAFAAAPRAIFAVASDADVEGRRLFLCVKQNLAPMPPALAFSLTSDGGLEWEPQPVEGVNADSVLSAPSAGEEREERQTAKKFLRELLTESGPMKAMEILKAAKQNGVAERTLYRAKARLGVKSFRDGPVGPWYWYIPEPEPAEPELPSKPVPRPKPKRSLLHVPG